MQLSKQVCSIGQAKRLIELGVIATNPALYWYSLYVSDIDNELGVGVGEWAKEEDFSNLYVYTSRGFMSTQEDLTEEPTPAFTVAELGVALPAFDCYSWRFEIQNKTGWSASLLREGAVSLSLQVAVQRGDTEAQARAALLIHLLETGKVTQEEVNARLSS